MCFSFNGWEAWVNCSPSCSKELCGRWKVAKLWSRATVANRGKFTLGGMRPPQRGAWEDDEIKKFTVVFAVQGLATTYRYPMTTGGMGWWRDPQRGNGTKKVENHWYAYEIVDSVFRSGSWLMKGKTTLGEDRTPTFQYHCFVMSYRWRSWRRRSKHHTASIHHHH